MGPTIDLCSIGTPYGNAVVVVVVIVVDAPNSDVEGFKITLKMFHTVKSYHNRFLYWEHMHNCDYTDLLYI